MLHSGDLVKIELILVVEQETPPLYLWKAPNRLIERFIPYLVKLPVPLVPLEKIPVPALHLPKLHKELFRHFQLVGFALPSLKLIKYLVPLSVDSSRSVYALTLYAILLSSCKK